jgi:hypothetical protein
MYEDQSLWLLAFFLFFFFHSFVPGAGIGCGVGIGMFAIPHRGMALTLRGFSFLSPPSGNIGRLAAPSLPCRAGRTGQLLFRLLVGRGFKRGRSSVPVKKNKKITAPC